MPDKSTAQTLGAFYKELTGEGLPAELVWEVVRDAGHTLIAENGLSVASTEPSA